MDLLLNQKVVISSHVSTFTLVEKDFQKPEQEVMLVLVHSLHSLVLQKLLLKPTIPSDYSRFMVLVVLLLPYPMLDRVKSTLVTLELISLLRSSSPHQPLVFYSSSLVDWMSVVSRRDHPTSRQHLQKLDMQNSALLEMHLPPSILDILEVVNSISMAMLSRSIPKTTLVLVLSSHLLVEQKVSLSIFQNLQLCSDLLEMRSRRTPRTTSVQVLCLPLFPRQNLQLLRNNQRYSSISKVLRSTKFSSIILVLVHSPSLVVQQKQEQLSRKQVVCSHSVATHQNLLLLHQKLVLVLCSHLLARPKHLLQATTLHHHYSRLVGMQSLDSLLVLLVVVDSMFFRKSPNSMLKVKTDLLVLKKEEQSTILLPYYSASTETSKSSLSSRKLVVDSPEFLEKHSPKLHQYTRVVVEPLSMVILLLESHFLRLVLEQSSDSLVEQKQLR